MARRAGHEEEDDAFGLSGKMPRPGRERVGRRARRGPAVVSKQLAKGNRSQPDAALLKKPAAGDQLPRLPAVKMCLAIHAAWSNTIETRRPSDFRICCSVSSVGFPWAERV